MKVSNGEPESPLQEASIGVPQTPSNSELVLQLASYSSRWPEGQDTVADTVHGCPCAAIICVQLLPRCTPRSLGIGAGFAVVDVLPKQRFQEWALPYLVDTKCENLQQVRVAVGPRAEEFAGIPCHVFKAVGREWCVVRLQHAHSAEGTSENQNHRRVSYTCRRFAWLDSRLYLLITLYLTYHRVFGHALPCDVVCLHWIWPRAHVDWTSVPHFGHECVYPRASKPSLTRNCLPQ